MKEQPQERHSRFNWTRLLFVIIGLLLLAVAFVLVMNMSARPGAAPAGVVRSVLLCGGICE